ncbi:hypothetical protein EG68_05994 [Paragonimus skrjabini miyazakii]|uniref:Uncharacterized protein n=1 Tax=Paragonimus skrjabini miyazakii TaxID=59628 RepID=A0A8S9YZS3_9TREM|nr:hypothetical protein EG68_05994 [Paragonimus skrjabini miyazakii]
MCRSYYSFIWFLLTPSLYGCLSGWLAISVRVNGGYPYVHMDEPVPVFFAANKADLSTQRKVTLEEGEKLASQQCAHGHFETSAKTGLNIINLFQHVAESMVSTWGAPKRWYEMNSQDDQGNHWPNQASGRQTVQLTYSTEKPKKRQCCQIK